MVEFITLLLCRGVKTPFFTSFFYLRHFLTRLTPIYRLPPAIRPEIQFRQGLMRVCWVFLRHLLFQPQLLAHFLRKLNHKRFLGGGCGECTNCVAANI